MFFRKNNNFEIKKNHLVMLLALSLGLGFQNCSKVAFSPTKLSSSSSGGALGSFKSSSLVINNGAAFTNMAEVQLGLQSEGAVEMYVTNSSGCQDGGMWEPMASTRKWTLAESNQLTYVYAQYKNAEGDLTSCVSASITHDDRPPEVEFTKGPDLYTNKSFAEFQVQLKTPDLSGIDKYECHIASEPFKECSESFDANPQDETSHTMYVRGVDKAGNTSSPAVEYTWMLDKTPPVLTITKAPSNPSSDYNASVGFTVKDDGGSGVDADKIYCQFDGTAAVASCTSEAKQLLNDGPHEFKLFATDRAGNMADTKTNWQIIGSPSGNFQVTGITGSGDTKVDNWLGKSLKPTVNWQASDGAVKYRVSILNQAGSAVICPEVEFAASPGALSNCNLMDNGHYNARVVAYAANNLPKAAPLFAFTVDNSGPIITIKTPIVSDDQKTVTIGYTITDAGSGVGAAECVRSFGANLDPLAGCKDKISVVYKNLPIGDHKFQIDAVDNVGISSTASATFQIKQIICDPFSPMNTAPCIPALKGKIFYQVKDWLTNVPINEKGYKNVGDYISKGEQAPAVLYMSKLMVPTRTFTAGFPVSDKDVVRKKDGEKLFEWFALQLDGVLKLAPTDGAGMYQIAIISDDGALVKYKDSSSVANYSTLINSDGFHGTKLACGAQVLTMNANSRLPIRVEYFQGPRERIALVLLYRKVTSNTLDALCGNSDVNFFGGTDTYPTGFAGTKYGQMLSRGWKPLSADNFVTN
jgi:hypothetical protein